jgi:TonB family protein
MRTIVISLGNILLWSCSALAQQVVSPINPPAQNRWWRQPEIIGQLKLTEPQISNIEQSVLAYQKEYNDFLRGRTQREEPFSKLMREDSINEENILKEIDKIVAERAAYQKAAYLAAFSIRKNLSQEQWMQLLRRSDLRWMDVFKNAITPPKCIHQQKPVYAQEARANRIEGIVALAATIHKDGSATVTKILRGLGHGLDQNAIDAVNKYWRFKPAEINGDPFEMEANIEISFRLY